MFAKETDGGLSLNEIVNKYKPTMLLGMTAVGGLFKEDLIKDMAKHCERPIIFPLSNPTTKAECSAKQAFEWTNGKCIFASGSPFDPVEMQDGRIFHPTQCNNMFVFPGIGLGATLCGAKTGKEHDYMLTREYAPCLTNHCFHKQYPTGCSTLQRKRWLTI